jgi:hypothetical protein
MLIRFVKKISPKVFLDFAYFIREIWRNVNPILLSRFDRLYIAPRILDFGSKKFCNINESRIIILVCCKNNYHFFHSVLLKYCLSNLSACSMVVVDDGSNGDLVDEVNFLNKYNILFLRNSGRGFQFALSTLQNHLKKNHIANKIVFQMSHDNYPIVENAIELLEQNADKMLSENIALIGLNTFDYRQTRKELALKALGKPVRFGMLGRRTLHKGEGGLIRADAIPKEISHCRYFEIEAPVDMSVMINLDLVCQFVKPSSDFWLFCWLDDISNTLLKNDQIILVDSDFEVFHCQELKRKFNLPVNSFTASQKGDSRYHSYHGHLEAWSKKWGYDRVSKSEVTNLINKFSGTRLAILIERSGILQKY